MNQKVFTKIVLVVFIVALATVTIQVSSAQTTTPTFTASPSSGTAPLAVGFSASGLTPSAYYGIVYGDGANSGVIQAPPCTTINGCTINANHTYTAAGTYTATLYSHNPMSTCVQTFCGSALATVTIQVSSAQSTLTITISSPLPSGQVGTAYSTTISGSGGITGSYTWNVISGSLPPGLSLVLSPCLSCQSSPATISGTPTASGTYTFTVALTDGSEKVSKQFNLAIVSAPITITLSPLPNGQVNSSYSAQVSASGGTGGYSWSVVSGALPPGLGLVASACLACQSPAQISGTPTTAGTYTFTLMVSDGSGGSATKQFSLTVAAVTTGACEYPNPPAGYHYESGQSYPACGAYLVKDAVKDIIPLTITTSSPLPNGQVNSSYFTQISATGGTGAYSWSITSGTLPSSLSIGPAPVCFGCPAPLNISGTPTREGTYTFTVVLTDGSRKVSKQFDLSIDPVLSTPTITSLSPSLGPIGTILTIYGSGFSTTNNTVHFDPGVIPHLPGYFSSDGRSYITFKVPSTLLPPCGWLDPPCELHWRTFPGIYDISVTNTAGTSNILKFKVTDSSTSAATKLKVTASVLNVRSGPGINYKVVTRVRRNDILENIANKNGWFSVALPKGGNGWVYGKFVRQQ